MTVEEAIEIVRAVQQVTDYADGRAEKVAKDAYLKLNEVPRHDLMNMAPDLFF